MDGDWVRGPLLLLRIHIHIHTHAHIPIPIPIDTRIGGAAAAPRALRNAFFFYQKRLEERLNTPFITSVYFKPDTAAQLDWDIKVKARGGAVAKELGTYHGKNSAAWDDELRVGDALSSSDSLLDSLLADAAARVSDDAEVIAPEDVVPVERPAGRASAADEKGDVRRLDRAMDRTLYLVVKGPDGWCFPADVIPDGENLHECAQRVLDQAAGVNMNTWIVGRVPVAHVVRAPRLAPDGAVRERGSKTFLLKGRIMAGQADLRGNSLGYTDFQWLTREELEKLLAPDYFKGVRNMMADR
ncbi:54S ribosomal protein L17 [Escovopsis weberi]|uniref:Large ribosomal subunit protein mL46 n=1 Tax=Escovopsis weberi TaxID=150374 RepID=A0A0M9VRZ2_ESCWE|nr:54S ribosomal protein L17 [Escovopsis weberi]